MKGIEKLIKVIGFGSFALLIVSFFGAMLATWIPGDPAFWTSALLWLSVVTAIVAPGMLVAFSGVGRVERRSDAVAPSPPEFDPADFEGDDVFGAEYEVGEGFGTRNPFESKKL